MTVSTTTSTITYQGNGSTSIFTFPFIADISTDISVILTSNLGTETVLNPSLYTLVINPPAPGQLWGIGGSVTYPLTGPPLPSGSQLTIVRTIPYTQATSISNQGAFYPQVIETALDILTMLVQQILTTSGYAIQCPIVDPATPNILPPAAERANKYLKFDNNGNPIVSVS